MTRMQSCQSRAKLVQKTFQRLTKALVVFVRSHSSIGQTVKISVPGCLGDPIFSLTKRDAIHFLI